MTANSSSWGLAIVPYAVVLLAYVAWAARMLYYFQKQTRGPLSSTGAILGFVCLAVAIVAFALSHRINDVVDAFPVMILSFVAWIAAGIRGETAATEWPKKSR